MIPKHVCSLLYGSESYLPVIWNSSPLAYLALEYSTAGIIILHWTACIHYALPVISGKLYGVSIDKYWIGKEHILEYSHPEQYIRSVFRAATLLFNIGHGGYVPTTALEIILNIVTVLIGYVYNAFLLVVYSFLVLVLQIMASNLSAELKYQEIINQVEQYMTCKRLPISMQKRLLQYYEYRFQKKYFRDNAISTSLSDRLRKEINLHSFRRLIESVSIFKDMPRNLILDIVSSLKEEIYLPNDIIVKAHSIGDCMYFLASGTVCVTTATGKEVCHLYDGAYFGEVALLMKDQMRVATVYALEICKIYRLDRTTFENCFVNNIELYKNILNIAQDRKERTAMLEEIHKTYITSLEESRM
ncbi:hypothetical protein FQA39_LY07308 [Lamprigera yunnana]|nr:hypothetical protein FQA39_LY07308 [Lamprigera yunnana]